MALFVDLWFFPVFPSSCLLRSQNCSALIRKSKQKQFFAHICKICANIHTYWKLANSNDGLSIEIIDRSHGEKTQDTSISDKTALKA